MNYADIVKLCAGRGTTIKALAEDLKMTPYGLRQGLERETLPIKKVKELCSLLHLTPNELLGVKVLPSNDLYVELVGQLHKKDEQIAALIAALK